MPDIDAHRRLRSLAIIAARDSAARRTRYRAFTRAAEWLHAGGRDVDGTPDPASRPRGRYADFDVLSRPAIYRQIGALPVIRSQRRA